MIDASLCGTANAEVTGNASLLYDLIEEGGEWSGESEQRINLDMRGKTGLGSLLGLSLGVMRRDSKFEFLGGVSPMYALSLQGKYYRLTSGYSIRTYRGIISSGLYGNLSLSRPDLPAFRMAYSKQDTRDDQEEHKINSTGSNVQLGLEDEIGPFHITLNRREYTSQDLIRGPEYNMESSNTSGNIDFRYFYRQLLSLNGRFGIGQLQTGRKTTGKTKGDNRDFSLGFRISPISTIALSVTTTGRREQREHLMVQANSFVTTSEFLTNRLQLILQPIKGIRLNTAYSMSDASRDTGRSSSNRNKLLVLDLEPWQQLAFSGQFTVHDAQEQGERVSNLRRNSFDVRAEPIGGLRILSRLDLSRSANFASGLRSDRNSVTASLESMLTESLRTDISYDWQKLIRRLRDVTNREAQHQVTFTVIYSFARMLDLSLRLGRNIYSVWEDSIGFIACGLNCSINESRFSLRYDQTSNPVRDPSLLQERIRTTRVFSIRFDQEVSRDMDLFLSYENRIGNGKFGYRGTKNFSFRMNVRF